MSLPHTLSGVVVFIFVATFTTALITNQGFINDDLSEFGRGMATINNQTSEEQSSLFSILTDFKGVLIVLFGFIPFMLHLLAVWVAMNIYVNPILSVFTALISALLGIAILKLIRGVWDF